MISNWLHLTTLCI